MGKGPLTGWGFGSCGGAAHPRRSSPTGFGRAGGWRHRHRATGQRARPGFGGWREPSRSADDERRSLKRDAQRLEAELRHLRARIEELEGPESD
jgi:hypothetical protein